jgi:hypothetical protein
MDKVQRWEKCPNCQEMSFVSSVMVKDIVMRCCCGTQFDIPDVPKTIKKDIFFKEEPKQEEIKDESKVD